MLGRRQARPTGFDIGRIRHRLDVERLHQINMIAGLLLGVFAAVLVGEVLLKALRVAVSELGPMIER